MVFGALRDAIDPSRLLQLVCIEITRAIQVAAGRHEVRILQLFFQFGAHSQQLQMPLRTCRGMARNFNIVNPHCIGPSQQPSLLWGLMVRCVSAQHPTMLAAQGRRSIFAAAAAHHRNRVPRLWRSLKTAQPKTTFQHVSPMDRCFHMWQTVKSSCKASRKDGEWLIRDVFINPKKRGLQDADFNRNLGISLLWQGIPALQRAASTSFHFQLPTISRGRDALELRFGAELRLTCQGKIGSQGTEKGFATKLLDKTELCGEHEMRNETVRRLTSLLLAPLLQRGPGVLAESLTSHRDASSCKRLNSAYVALGLNLFTTQSVIS